MTKMKLNRKRTEAKLKTLWDEKDLYAGNGITPSVPIIILPCDPIEVAERLYILMASKAIQE